MLAKTATIAAATTATAPTATYQAIVSARRVARAKKHATHFMMIFFGFAALVFASACPRLSLCCCPSALLLSLLVLLLLLLAVFRVVGPSLLLVFAAL